MQQLHTAARSGTLAGWVSSLPGSVVEVVVALVLGKHMFHQGWENTESGPCLRQEVSYQQYHAVHHYAPHYYSIHRLSCGCQPLENCWRPCLAVHMPLVKEGAVPRSLGNYRTFFCLGVNSGVQS